MTEDQEPEVHEAPLIVTGTPSRMLIVVAIGVLVLFCFLLLVVLLARNVPRLDSAASPTDNEILDLKTTIENQAAKLAELEEAASARTEEQVAARDTIAATLATAQQVARTIDQLKNNVTEWQTETANLLKNDRGKSIAADKDALNKFVDLYEAKLPDADLPTSLTGRLKPFLDHLQEAEKAPNASRYRPTETFVTQLQSLSQDATNALDAYVKRNDGLQLIVEQTPAPADLSTQPALADAIQQLHNQSAEDDLRRIREGVEAQQNEGIQKIVKAKADAANAKADAEAMAIKELGDAEAKGIIDGVKQRIEADRKEREKRLREQQFNAALPEIRQYLAPFLADSLFQPGESVSGDDGQKGSRLTRPCSRRPVHWRSPRRPPQDVPLHP